MLPVLYINPTQEKYHNVLSIYTQKDITSILKRQWQYINEPEQEDILTKSVIVTIGAVTYCTYKGIQYGVKVADEMNLKDKERYAVIACGGGVGFVAGVAFSVTCNGLVIQHTKRLEDWRNKKIDKSLENLMTEEFENDPILSQFIDAISQRPIFVPVRTPSGNVFDFDSLLSACDSNGFIKDIYNKRIAVPTTINPQATIALRYHIETCIQDHEMLIVILKRFRHLATFKSQEPGLTENVKMSLLSWRNSLGETVKPIYMSLQDNITQKRDRIQNRHGCTDVESNLSESIFTDEMASFKNFFGSSSLSDINWQATNNWSDLLQTRWVSTHN